jgi:hypothetical protein
MFRLRTQVKLLRPLVYLVTTQLMSDCTGLQPVGTLKKPVLVSIKATGTSAAVRCAHSVPIHVGIHHAGAVMPM